MPFNVGPMELVIVLVIALVVLGPKRLPEAGKAVGRGLREFKGAISGESAAEPEAVPDLDRHRSIESPATAQTQR
jgi:sec-independent protein translocase protein TatA